MIEQVVGGRNIFQFNWPLQPPTWDGEDGLRAGQIAYDEDGIVVPGSPGPIWWDGVAWNRYSSSTDVPDLQAVTDEGAVTDVSMSVRVVGADGPVAELEVSANSGASIVKLQAARESGIDKAVIFMDGTDAQISIPINVNLRIVDGTDNVVLTLLADGTGIIDRNGVKHVSGTGSPEGTLAAMPGSSYSRIDGNPGETFYIKQSGNGNTGWAPIA